MLSSPWGRIPPCGINVIVITEPSKVAANLLVDRNSAFTFDGKMD